MPFLHLIPEGHRLHHPPAFTVSSSTTSKATLLANKNAYPTGNTAVSVDTSQCKFLKLTPDPIPNYKTQAQGHARGQVKDGDRDNSVNKEK